MTAKLKANDTIGIKRGHLLAALELIGINGTGTVPFRQVAELVAAMQEAAKSPKMGKSKRSWP